MSDLLQRLLSLAVSQCVWLQKVSLSSITDRQLIQTQGSEFSGVQLQYVGNVVKNVTSGSGRRLLQASNSAVQALALVSCDDVGCP